MDKTKIEDHILQKNGFVKSANANGDELFQINKNGRRMDVVKTSQNKYYSPNIGFSFEVAFIAQINPLFKAITSKDIEY